MTSDHLVLTWVLPLYKTAEFVPELVARIEATSERLGLGGAYNIVLVDDACPAGSGAAADKAAIGRPHLHALHLPVNHGQDAALRRGLGHARGTWVVILDADLQDPPEALADLWPHRIGHDVVFADRMGDYESFSRRMTSRLYRRLMSAIGGLPHGAGLYALMACTTARAIATDSTDPFALLATIAAHRGRMMSVRVQRQTRATGRSSYTFGMRLRKAVTGIGQSLRNRIPGIPA